MRHAKVQIRQSIWPTSQCSDPTSYGYGEECVSYFTNKMPFFTVRPCELLIVTMNALPMGSWPVVCDQILRCESRATTLGLKCLCDGGQRLDDIDSLEPSTKRGCNGGPSASLLGLIRMR